MAKSYQQAFELVQGNYYIKQNFQITKNCNSRFTSNNTNLVSHLLNSIISTLNNENYMPEYALIVLDVDIVEALQYTGPGFATVVGKVLDYLASKIFNSFADCKMKLPEKLQPVTPTQIYWVACPTHFNFSDNEVRNKFSFTLDSVLKQYKQMRAVKLVEVWDKADANLVVNNRITCDGLHCYWAAVDAAIRYNVLKHREFVINDRYNTLTKARKNGENGEEAI